MSLVQGARESDEADMEHATQGLSVQDDVDSIYRLDVPARTLTSVLDEVGVQEVDFFSLDVEGYELNVLKGLDLKKYRPKYILVEVKSRDEIDAYLSTYYEAVEDFSGDVLYRQKGVWQ